jgi:glucose-6-phosphate 1-dehydrogenase
MSTLQSYNHPSVIVVFGGTGDLAQTKLFPALYDLYCNQALPDRFSVIGLSRKTLSNEDYQTFVRESILRKLPAADQSVLSMFCSHFTYVAGSFDESVSYERIKQSLEHSDNLIGQCTNKLFYLAVPPEYYEVIFENLKRSNVMALCDGVDSWSRLLVEKPFGRDLKTAQLLEKQLSAFFNENQIYRIDHYLAKDAIENIISLRFANSIVADSWNSDRIESISIRLLETNDVSRRGSFYDGIGTLRDVGQNHMLQIFALLTMEKVDVRNAEAVRLARAAALKIISDQVPSDIIRAQYDGFLETVGVERNSHTETYFKISFTPKTSIWKGVRCTLEAGKALNQSLSEATVTFRSEDLCHCGSLGDPHSHKNTLRIQFAPEQRISLSMWGKKSGLGFELEERELVLLTEKSTEDYSPEAYERVLYDCIAGDQTRFVSGPEVEAAWQFITPIIESFSQSPMKHYPPGSIGPVAD